MRLKLSEESLYSSNAWKHPDLSSSSGECFSLLGCEVSFLVSVHLLTSNRNMHEE